MAIRELCGYCGDTVEDCIDAGECNYGIVENCASCDRVVDATDTVITGNNVVCTFCAITEHGYYAKPEEHLPDEYYLWLQERDEDGIQKEF